MGADEPISVGEAGRLRPGRGAPLHPRGPRNTALTLAVARIDAIWRGTRRASEGCQRGWPAKNCSMNGAMSTNVCGFAVRRVMTRHTSDEAAG